MFAVISVCNYKMLDILITWRLFSKKKSKIVVAWNENAEMSFWLVRR